MARVAKNLTKPDEIYLKAISRYGYVTVDASGLDSAGVEGDQAVTPYRVRRLIELGYLVASKDGLLDGCPQTYRIARPDPH
jgi:hypothetical protein